jgi:hypothetical protein
MAGTSCGGRLMSGYDPWILDGGSELALGYVFRSDGSLQYDGVRPGVGWDAHGWFSKRQVRLRRGHPVWFVIHKRRWLLRGTQTTCHSRPLDDGFSSAFVSILMTLRIVGVIDSPVGFHRRAEVHEGLEEVGSDRTVQRWVARAQAHAIEIQQAIRLALIEEAEPRPVESLFEGGLSPPDAVTSRRWLSPAKLTLLWRGYAMLLVGARQLAKHASYLLAEARRRWQTTTKPTCI